MHGEQKVIEKVVFVMCMKLLYRDSPGKTRITAKNSNSRYSNWLPYQIQIPEDTAIQRGQLSASVEMNLYKFIITRVAAWRSYSE
jgi:hypothetical protein